MLQNLHVKNLALIDETDVEFGKGLNILTGETGAGKSLLVGSINLALGSKADSDLIRKGEESALVELTFQSKDTAVYELLESMDIPTMDDSVFISRKILPGRSVIKINGETVNARQLKAVTELLIDIHGQHEHQSLLKKSKHLEILDSFAGEEMQKLLEALKEEYKNYKNLKSLLDDQSMDDEERVRSKELYSFELKEIEEAALKVGEDEELENAYRKLSNAKRIGESLSKAAAISGSDEEGSAGAALSLALKELRSVSSLDEELSEMEKTLGEIEGMLHDFHRDCENYIDGLEVDGETYYYTENRLNLINHLKDKYKPSIEGILEYRGFIAEKLSELDNYEENVKVLQEKVKKSYECVQKIAGEVSNLRLTKAPELEKRLVAILEDLNFETVKFKIKLSKAETVNETGFDDVEFLICTNLGEELKPLKDVASGGELSRIMLGIKTLLADRDSIDTLIFDEIDAGISGRTAWQVSGKLGDLAKAHQVICITHLPQIAAKADNHFMIEKRSDEGRTNTYIVKLDEAGCEREVARLLGSETTTESALENAKELLKKAHE